MSGLIIQFAYEYTDEKREELKKYDNVESLSKYLKKQKLVETFVKFAEEKGLRRRNLMIRKSYNLLEFFINSRVVYNMLNEEAWTEFINSDDPAIDATVKVFEEKAAFPKALEEEDKTTQEKE